jgi:hypothetical protein
MAALESRAQAVACGLACWLAMIGEPACSAGDASQPPDSTAAGGASAGATGAGATGAGTTGAGADRSGGGNLFGTGGSDTSGGMGGTNGGGGMTGGGACTGQPVVPPDKQATEVCDNGLDDDLNGFVDENCSCHIGTTQPCFVGSAWQASQPNCKKGTQTCGGTSEFPAWGPCQNSGCGVVIPTEICNNGIDDNCDGRIDEGCSFTMTVTIDGDCIGIPCPPQAPNPVGCKIDMQGNDSRGCVAHAAGNNAVYFQEGNACPIPGCGALCGNAGHISGTLECSASPDPVTLDKTNCAINKAEPTYTDNPGGCPH